MPACAVHINRRRHKRMLDGGFSDPRKEMAAWLLVFQHCSKRLGEELLKLQGEEGPPPRF